MKLQVNDFVFVLNGNYCVSLCCDMYGGTIHQFEGSSRDQLRIHCEMLEVCADYVMRSSRVEDDAIL